MKIFPQYQTKNYTKCYSLIDNWTAERLPYVATLAKPGVPHPLVEWCENNCQGKWSWWFDEYHAYIGFEDRYEAFMFKLLMPLGGSQ